MPADVSVENLNGYVYLVSPYNPQIPSMAKRLNGRWDSNLRAWRFDVRDRARVEKIACDIFGWSPRPCGTVDVRINAEAFISRDAPSRVIFAGRSVARRMAKNTSVTLPRGVVLVDGNFAASGGSNNCPEIGETDAVLEIRDLPESALEGIDAGLYQIVGHSDNADLIATLIEEREHLMDRIHKIDKRLDQLLADDSPDTLD